MLIEHMATGYTFESFAGRVGVCRDTLYNWAEVNAQFLDAKKVGLEKGRLFWERIGLGGAAGSIKNFNATVYVFTMKNRFGWKDKQEIEGSIKFEPLEIISPLAGKKYTYTFREQNENVIQNAEGKHLSSLRVLEPDASDSQKGGDQNGGVPSLPASGKDYGET